MALKAEPRDDGSRQDDDDDDEEVHTPNGSLKRGKKSVSFAAEQNRVQFLVAEEETRRLNNVVEKAGCFVTVPVGTCVTDIGREGQNEPSMQSPPRPSFRHFSVEEREEEEGDGFGTSWEVQEGHTVDEARDSSSTSPFAIVEKETAEEINKSKPALEHNGALSEARKEEPSRHTVDGQIQRALARRLSREENATRAIVQADPVDTSMEVVGKTEIDGSHAAGGMDSEVVASVDDADDDDDNDDDGTVSVGLKREIILKMSSRADQRRYRNNTATVTNTISGITTNADLLGAATAATTIDSAGEFRGSEERERVGQNPRWRNEATAVKHSAEAQASVKHTDRGHVSRGEGIEAWDATGYESTSEDSGQNGMFNEIGSITRTVAPQVAEGSCRIEGSIMAGRHDSTDHPGDGSDNVCKAGKSRNWRQVWRDRVRIAYTERIAAEEASIS